MAKLKEIKKNLVVFREGDEDIVEFITNSYMQFTPMLKKLIREEMVRKGLPVNTIEGLDLQPQQVVYQQVKLDVETTEDKVNKPFETVQEDMIEIDEDDDFLS